MIFNNYHKDYDKVLEIEEDIFSQARETKEHKDFVKKFMEDNK